MEETLENTTKSQTGNSLVLSSSFNAEELSALRSQAIQSIGVKMRIPGFRPGKAPLSVLSNYVKESDVNDDLLQAAASKSYSTFLKEDKSTDALIFEPEILSTTWGSVETPALELELRVFRLPRTDREFWSSIEVEDTHIDVESAVERRISALVETATELVPKSGAAGPGDSVGVSILTAGGQRPYRTELVLGEGTVGRAYQDVVAGMNVGESRHFSVTLQEKPLEGDLTLETVAERHVPEVNDEFAHSLGAYDSLDALRASLRAEEEKRAEEERDDSLFAHSVDVAAQRLDLQFPLYVRREETERRVAEMRDRLARNGLSLNEYLKYNSLELGAFTSGVESEAAKGLERELLMEATQRSCEILVDDNDAASYAETNGDELKKAGIDIASYEGKIAIRNIILWQRTRKLIVESVRLKEPGA
jgi:trigger factor